MIASVYVDGACSLKKNKGKVGIYSEELDIAISKDIENLVEKKTCSIAELLALKIALDILDCNEIKKNYDKIKIYSDSQYVVYTFTKWINKWIEKGWKKCDNKEIKHLEIIQNIYNILVANPNYELIWIPREKNKKADALSKS
tara:strand:+ start:2138 stop:2566 length:429 start_codon:yes stop_codon:yes gene_type:complete